MADIEWKQHTAYLSAFGHTFGVNEQVKNELNGERPKDLIFHTTDKNGQRGVPAQPRIFPAGRWRVYAPRAINPAEDPNRYKMPYFIPTDAHQTLDEWELRDGIYLRKTGRTVEDYAYGFHFSTFAWTVGCLRFTDINELLLFVRLHNAALAEIANPAQKWLSLEVAA